ncbi:hypothetical protein N9X05_16475 [Paracoccaceae bacterium]|nr:hypothetical protein [Paracoccaceae bacterium]
MSYSTDSYTQEDTCTFPVYQRLRKTNPYAYYSLDAQKQMQQDLREAGSLVFFEQDEDALPEPDEAVGLMSLPDALSEADQMIETGDADFLEKAETVLGVLYATDTLPIRRSALNGSNHKTLAAMIVLMMDQCCQVEVNEYNTTELKASGYSKSFMQYMERADARGVLEVVQRTPHTAIYYVGDSLTGVFADADH